MGIVPGSGHWIMDENPNATTESIVNFLSNWQAAWRSSYGPAN
jgi:pimeloyl-ACP methyl ester carboxylesterase